MGVSPEEILTQVQDSELKKINALEGQIDEYLRSHFTGSPVYYDTDNIGHLSTAGFRELCSRYPGWTISFDSSPKNESFWVFTPKTA